MNLSKKEEMYSFNGAEAGAVIESSTKRSAFIMEKKFYINLDVHRLQPVTSC